MNLMLAFCFANKIFIADDLALNRKSTYWVAVVKPGRVMFEMAGVDLATAKEAMTLAAHKLPIHTRFVSREGAL